MFRKLINHKQEFTALEAEDDLLFEDAPDEFMDPIMGYVMKDPVILPSSKQTVDRSTISRHLLRWLFVADRGFPKLVFVISNLAEIIRKFYFYLFLSLHIAKIVSKGRPYWEALIQTFKTVHFENRLLKVKTISAIYILLKLFVSTK